MLPLEADVTHIRTKAKTPKFGGERKGEIIAGWTKRRLSFLSYFGGESKVFFTVNRLTPPNDF